MEERNNAFTSRKEKFLLPPVRSALQVSNEWQWCCGGGGGRMGRSVSEVTHPRKRLDTIPKGSVELRRNVVTFTRSISLLSKRSYFSLSSWEFRHECSIHMLVSSFTFTHIGTPVSSQMKRVQFASVIWCLSELCCALQWIAGAA